MNNWIGSYTYQWYQSLDISHNSCLLHFSPGILLASPLPDCLLRQSASLCALLLSQPVRIHYVRLFSARTLWYLTLFFCDHKNYQYTITVMTALYLMSWKVYAAILNLAETACASEYCFMTALIYLCLTIVSSHFFSAMKVFQWFLCDRWQYWIQVAALVECVVATLMV